MSHRIEVVLWRIRELPIKQHDATVSVPRVTLQQQHTLDLISGTKKKCRFGELHYS